jgi:hypothetical protein
MHSVVRYLIRNSSRLINRIFGKILPNNKAANYVCAVRGFVGAHGRLPLREHHPEALLNDFTFHRQIGNRWTSLQLDCVDKELAKKIAVELSRGEISVPETVAIVCSDGTLDVRKAIAPYIGQNVIAKPTHWSGAVIYLSEMPDEMDIAGVQWAMSRNFFYRWRESQYFHLKPKLLIEKVISGKNEIVDFKFFCGRGRPIICQVDTHRHTSHRRNLYDLPAFDLLDSKLVFPRDATFKLPPKETLDRMLSLASTLAKPFDFVRIDLYTVRDRIYFGEFTFGPGAALEAFSDVSLSRRILSSARGAI